MKATTMIQEYGATEAVIETLREKYAGKVYDVSTKDGMEWATVARNEIRRWRTGLERTRVAIKAPALELCKNIDSEAKRITAELLSLETPIDAQIKAEEKKAEDAAKAKMDEIIAKAKAFEEMQAAQAKAAEQAALQAQRDEIARQRAEVEAAAAEQRKVEEAARAARMEADRVASEARAAEKKKLDDERAAFAAKAAARAAEEKAAKDAADKQLIATVSLLDAAKMAVKLLDEFNLGECVETLALVAAIKRVEDGK